MIKKYICMLGLGGCLFLSGCSSDVATPEGDGILPIRFTASRTGVSVDTETQTRNSTPADFPGDKSIAVVAANSNSGTVPTDWGDTNLYLNHAAATAGTVTNVDGANVTTYPVTLNTQAYWPFNPDKYLGFVAYSPASNSALTHTGTDLTVSIDAASKPFFDLLYTTPTSKAYNKVSGEDGADLGEFKHAMAGLVVKVTPVDAITGEEVSGDAIKGLKIEKLNIQTKVTTGTFNLNSSTWTLTAPAEDADYITSQTLISTSTALPYNKDEKVIGLLFPATTAVNTVELSAIGFTLKDGAITSVDNKTYKISDFKDGGNSVKLEMGKTTILNIKVKVTSVETGEDNKTTLEGTLVDWIYKGSSSVTIE